VSYTDFRKIVWVHYKKHGRHTLPWRQTRDPYEILVSEMMLQQTQVERVVPFYKQFLKRFPTPQALARAPLSAVLKVWQGLGYNRRAKMLHQAAKEIMKRGMPQNAAAFEKLSGAGPYTARAVAAFAFSHNVVLVETNTRTAVIHHFFNASAGMIYHTNAQKVSDSEIERILKHALPKGRACEWYWALMDYGAHLKEEGVKLNKKSRRYIKQSRFTGSLREARGAIVRALTKRRQGKTTLENLLGAARRLQVKRALAALTEEGLIQKRSKTFALAR